MIGFNSKVLLNFVFGIIASLMMSLTVHAQNDNVEKKDKESPWIFAPLVSSDPKLSTSLGAMGGYLYKFDEKSPASTFAAMGTYSDSDSSVYGTFARMYFKEDTQRMVLGFFGGEINNDYDDFLGIGWPAQTTDDLKGIFARYTYKIKGQWFFGVTGLSSNYAITGGDMWTEAILKLIGLTGFDSNALGLVVERDTRDNQNSPSKGSKLTLQNLAYRESLGGDETFDAYTLKFSKYNLINKRHTLAYRVEGRWTDDAPLGGYSSIDLRGYTRGEYLAKHSTTAELEGRFSLNKRWGATVFTGAAVLYDKSSDTGDSQNWYPSIGGGINYILKPQEKMIVRGDVAFGEGGRYGVYLQFGNAF